MMKVLQDAIEKVQRLPEDRQALAAELLEQLAAGGTDVFVVPEEDRAAIVEGLRQAERGEFASDADVEAVLRKPWR